MKELQQKKKNTPQLEYAFGLTLHEAKKKHIAANTRE